MAQLTHKISVFIIVSDPFLLWLRKCVCLGDILSSCSINGLLWSL
jgi:hypothetical protein